MKIKAGRHIEGIFLNPLAHVLDGHDGDIRRFGSKESAAGFLKEAGAGEDGICWHRFVNEEEQDIDGPELRFD